MSHHVIRKQRLCRHEVYSAFDGVTVEFRREGDAMTGRWLDMHRETYSFAEARALAAALLAAVEESERAAREREAEG